MADRGQPAGARRLLVGDGVDDQVAAQAHAQLGQQLGGEHHCGDAALHVAGAAPVEVAVAHLGRERVARPALARLGRHHVDVAVEQQAGPPPDAGEAGGHLRAALEAERAGDLAAARDLVGRPAPTCPRRRRRRTAARPGSAAARPRRGPAGRPRGRWCRSRSGPSQLDQPFAAGLAAAITSSSSPTLRDDTGQCPGTIHTRDHAGCAAIAPSFAAASCAAAGRWRWRAGRGRCAGRVRRVTAGAAAAPPPRGRRLAGSTPAARNRPARPAPAARPRPLHRQRPPPATGSVTLSAVGDTMLGYAGSLAPNPGSYFDGVQLADHRRHPLRQPGGRAHQPHLRQVRGADHLLLRVSAAAVVGALLPPRRLHDHQQCQQPRLRLLAGRAGRHGGGARPGRARPHRPHPRDHLPKTHGITVAFIGVASYPNTGPLNDYPAARP